MNRQDCIYMLMDAMVAGNSGQFYQIRVRLIMTDLIVVAALQGWIKTSFWHSPLRWLMESMFPNVMMAMADFFVGLVLYKLTITERSG